MVTLKRLCAALDSLGIPWANQRFADGQEPQPPFICLVAGYSGAAHADNGVWQGWMEYDVALYTRERDYASERRIAGALDAIECPHSLSVTQIDSENLIEAAFSVNVDESQE